jgi:hypothetical protein
MRALPLAVHGGSPPGEEHRAIGAQPSMALSETRSGERMCPGKRTR